MGIPIKQLVLGPRIWEFPGFQVVPRLHENIIKYQFLTQFIFIHILYLNISKAIQNYIVWIGVREDSHRKRYKITPANLGTMGAWKSWHHFFLLSSQVHGSSHGLRLFVKCHAFTVATSCYGCIWLWSFGHKLTAPWMNIMRYIIPSYPMKIRCP